MSKPKNEDELPKLRFTCLVAERSQTIPSFDKNIISNKDFHVVEFITLGQYESFIENKEKEAKRGKSKAPDATELSSSVSYLKMFIDNLKERAQLSTMKNNKENSKVKKKDEEVQVQTPLSDYFDYVFVFLDFQKELESIDLNFLDMNIHFSSFDLVQVSIDGVNTKGLSYEEILGLENTVRNKAVNTKAEELKASHSELVRRSHLHSRMRNSLFFEFSFEYVETADKALIAQNLENLHKVILYHLNIHEKKLSQYYAWLESVKLKKYTFPPRKHQTMDERANRIDKLFNSVDSDKYFSSNLLRAIAVSIGNPARKNNEEGQKDEAEAAQLKGRNAEDRDLKEISSEMYYQKLSSLYDNDLEVDPMNTKAQLEMRKRVLLHSEALNLTEEHVCQKMNLHQNKPELFEQNYYVEKISREEYQHRSFSLLQKKLDKVTTCNAFDNSKFISFPSTGNRIGLEEEEWDTETLFIPHANRWLLSQSNYEMHDAFIDYDMFKIYQWSNKHCKTSLSDDLRTVTRETRLNNKCEVQLNIYKGPDISLYIKKAANLALDSHKLEKHERLEEEKQSELVDQYTKYLESRKKIPKGSKLNIQDYGGFEDMVYLDSYSHLEKGDCLEIKLPDRTSVYIGKEVYYKDQSQEAQDSYLPDFLFNTFGAQQNTALGYSFTYKASERLFIKVLPDGNLYMRSLDDATCLGKLYFKNGCVVEYQFKPQYRSAQTLIEMNRIFDSTLNDKNGEAMRKKAMDCLNIVTRYPSGFYRVFDGSKTVIVNENSHCYTIDNEQSILEDKPLHLIKRSASPVDKYPYCEVRSDGYKMIRMSENSTAFIHPNNLQVIRTGETGEVQIQEKLYPVVTISRTSRDQSHGVIPPSQLDRFEDKCFEIRDTEAHNTIKIFKPLSSAGAFEVYIKTSKGDITYLTSKGKISIVPSTILDNLSEYCREKQLKQSLLEKYAKGIQTLTYHIKKLQAKFVKIKKPKKKDQEKLEKLIQDRVEDLKSAIKRVFDDTDSQALDMEKTHPEALYNLLIGDSLMYKVILVDLEDKLVTSHDYLDRRIELTFDNKLNQPGFGYKEIYELLRDRIDPLVSINDNLSSRTIVEPPTIEELTANYDRYFSLISTKKNKENLFRVTDKEVFELISPEEFRTRHAADKTTTHCPYVDSVKAIKHVETCRVDDSKLLRAQALFDIRLSNHIDVLTYSNISDEERYLTPQRRRKDCRYYIRYDDRYSLEDFRALVKQIDNYTSQVRKFNAYYALEAAQGKIGNTLLTKAQRVRIVDSLCRFNAIEPGQILDTIDRSLNAFAHEVIQAYYEEAHDQLFADMREEEIRFQTIESSHSLDSNPYYELNEDEAKTIRRKKEEKQLKLLCSRFVSNYFQTYHGSIYALKNPKQTHKKSLTAEEKGIIEGLLKASEGIPKENFTNSCNVNFGDSNIYNRENNEQNHSKPVDNKSSRKSSSQKFIIKTKSVYKQTQEALKTFKQQEMEKERQARERKTAKYTNRGEMRDSIDISAIYKRKNRPEYQNIDVIERDAEVDKRVRTSSMSRKMYLNAQSIQDTRTTSKHRLLLQALDTAFPVDFMQYKAKLMPTYVLNDKTYHDITIYPHIINFGSVKGKSYYETKFYIVNDDSLMQKVSVKPPLESQNVFVIYEQGGIAPGMKKKVRVQLDTKNLKTGFYRRIVKVKTKYQSYDVAIIAFIDTPQNKDLILSSDVELIDNPYQVEQLQMLPEDTNIHTQVGKTQGITSINIPKLSYDANFNLVLTKQNYTANGESSSLP